ncbi:MULTISPECIES: hypothetical protein [Asanoa]|uniref:hypothetical protein n=1 Tax=Asanoa TaxID=195964 RepID=UPI00117E734C|nr:MULTISPECIES: hypothetical protein [Asanoa]
MTTYGVSEGALNAVRALYGRSCYQHAALRAARCLSQFDPTTVGPDPVLMELALLYAASAVHAAPAKRTSYELQLVNTWTWGRPACSRWAPTLRRVDLEAALHWARYAQNSAWLVDPPGAPRRAAALQAVAALAHQLGFHHEAIVFAARLLTIQRETRKVDGLVHAELTLGIYLHASGSCTDGTMTATGAWRRWKNHYGSPRENTAALIVNVHVASLLMACGRATDGQTLMEEVVEPTDLLARHRTAMCRNVLDRLEGARLSHAAVHHNRFAVAVDLAERPRPT